MPLILGVLGIPKVEVELVKIIVRLSSNLNSLWTVSDSGACDLLLMDGSMSSESWLAPSPPYIVVLVVRRSESDVSDPASSRTLRRPIFAEELVDLLNEVSPALLSRKTADEIFVRPTHNRASLIRWPSQTTMQKKTLYLRLAAALSKSAQSSKSLSALSGVDINECSAFMALLEQEGVLVWSSDVDARDAGDVESALQRTGLLSRIRRRLGLA